MPRLFPKVIVLAGGVNKATGVSDPELCLMDETVMSLNTGVSKRSYARRGKYQRRETNDIVQWNAQTLLPKIRGNGWRLHP